MYINFWYAMEQSSNLPPGELRRLKRLNQDFVMWRGEDGHVHCLHDVCTHRGGSLGGGKLRDDCVQCPYHGWRFQGSGECVYIPSLGKDNQRIPARTRVDSYPTQEHRGVVFAFLGDLPEDERPPLMHPGANPKGRDYGAGEWRSVALGWDVGSNYERCVENGLDPAHNEFVHPTHGYGGQNLDEYHVPEYTVEHHPWGQGFMVDFNAPPSADVTAQQSGRDTGGKMKAGAGHNGPNQVWTYIHLTEENWAHQYLYETPVDSRHTHAINISLVNFVSAETPDEDINAMNAYIAEQDVTVLDAVRPIITPESMKHEVLTPSDRCVNEYRRYLRRWDDSGWRIDARKVESELGEKVYAIPSPARREHENWVFPPVPLVART